MDAKLKTSIITRCGQAAFAASTISLITLITSSSASPRAAHAADVAAEAPTNIQLIATIRDFKGRDQAGGHTDFEWEPSSGYGHYIGQVTDTPDADGLPKFNSSGYEVMSQWTDASGRNVIRPRSYISSRPGDQAGSASNSTGGSIHAEADFRQWFRDVPGVNMRTDATLTLVYDAATNQYIFDDTIDPAFQSLGGFFPINGKLFGNYNSTGKNYHLTCMLETSFTHAAGAGHTFTFRGDDDVWVYVDNKLVIDLGGVHGVISQTIELDRLAWLVTGQTYSLRFFFAERHTTKSNFRIETTLRLQDATRRPAIKGWEEVEPMD